MRLTPQHLRTICYAFVEPRQKTKEIQKNKKKTEQRKRENPFILLHFYHTKTGTHMRRCIGMVFRWFINYEHYLKVNHTFHIQTQCNLM